MLAKPQYYPETVRNIREVIDTAFTMKHHGKSVIKAYHLQLRSLSKICKYLTEKTGEKSERVLFDECSVMLCSSRLEQKKKNVYKLILQDYFSKQKSFHITSVLKDVHRLLVHASI